MTETPLTRATLLLRLRDTADTEAWEAFLRDYGPMLYRFIRSRGLQDADAADVVQDVLRSVGMAIDRFDYAKEKGGFRAWLFTITRNKLSTYFEKRKRASPTANDTAQLELLKQESAGKDELQESWDREHQRQIAAKAMRLLQPTIEPNTWMAFTMTAVDGMTAEDVATRLSMSKGAVYVARSRVTAKLRNEVARILAEEDAGELV
ncbi:RNA polymerase sigma-70 factor (ECF subfamily) [Rhodopirellula rubra]|uniref:RNA polymerase sigma-70 factor (ECF subfamily) n=1 Tax=Aporhodopirellula rubra TaxID=980271 RepID=A0A7W5DWE2_9BACT|nr:sigma-70 family RNA polymerase sigma factor [Aporhodopirellula rubra]MBB3205655.1 RNA polymerase sigma-70 factor (ECF subfamily) [Aporhodopirellula rubra]